MLCKVVNNAMNSELTENNTKPGELERSSVIALNNIAQHFLKKNLDSPEEAIALGTRLAKIIDTFMRSLLALQAGQLHFQQALNINSMNTSRSNSNEQALSLDTLSKSLFSLESNDTVIKSEIESAFKYFLIQQVALLSGLLTAVRNLLTKLDPELIEQHTLKEHNVIKSDQLWTFFQERYYELVNEDDDFIKVIFGQEFDNALKILSARGN